MLPSARPPGGGGQTLAVCSGLSGPAPSLRPPPGLLPGRPLRSGLGCGCCGPATGGPLHRRLRPSAAALGCRPGPSPVARRAPCPPSASLRPCCGPGGSVGLARGRLRSASARSARPGRAGLSLLRPSCCRLPGCGLGGSPLGPRASPVSPRSSVPRCPAGPLRARCLPPRGPFPPSGLRPPGGFGPSGPRGVGVGGCHICGPLPRVETSGQGPPLTVGLSCGGSVSKPAAKLWAAAQKVQA